MRSHKSFENALKTGLFADVKNFAGLVWLQFLHYRKIFCMGHFLAYINHILGGGQNFIKIFSGRDKLIHMFYFNLFLLDKLSCITSCCFVVLKKIVLLFKHKMFFNLFCKKDTVNAGRNILIKSNLLNSFCHFIKMIFRKGILL